MNKGYIEMEMRQIRESTHNDSTERSLMRLRSTLIRILELLDNELGIKND